MTTFPTSSPPLVSVLMAVYNSERYVAQAVESILHQTFQDFELIIIDDGSTDRSLPILYTYASCDQRIRLISRENRGIPRTRNELLAQASGEFVAVMDSDDIALSNRLALQIAFLRQNPQVVCVGGAYEVIDAAGRFLTQLQMPLENEEIQRLSIAGHTSINNPCAMVRRESLLAIGGYDERMEQCEDLDVWLKLGEIGELANLLEPVLQYRLHPHSISERDGQIQTQKAREACQQAWQRRGITSQFEMTEHWRPSQDRHSQHRFMLQYGWWAFNSDQRQTAAIYGLKAIQVLPLGLEGWKLLSCALFKPLPKSEI